MEWKYKKRNENERQSEEYLCHEYSETAEGRENRGIETQHTGVARAQCELCERM